MLMPADEILVSFRQARDQRAQIGVLADLNVCSPREIAQLLDDAGALEPLGLSVTDFPEVSSSAARRLNKDFDEAEALELFRAGLEDVAIADRLHVAVYRIQAWRGKNKLRRKYSWRKDHTLEFKPEEGDEMKKDTAKREEAALEAIADSVDAQAPMHAAQEPEAPATLLTVEAMLTTVATLVSPKLLHGELLIDGRPIEHMFGCAIRLRGNRVYVDLQTVDA